MGHRALTDENAGYLAQLTAGSPVLTGFHREPTFRDIRLPIGNTCRASSYNAPTKPSGPTTRMLDFKRVLRRPIETATQSGRRAVSVAFFPSNLTIGLLVTLQKEPILGTALLSRACNSFQTLRTAGNHPIRQRQARRL